MSIDRSTNQKGSHDSHSPRPKYIDVGTDRRGRFHCYDTRTETVHVVVRASDVAFTGQPRAARIDLAADDDIDCIEDYIAKYGHPDDRDWQDLRYGLEALFTPLEAL